MGASWEGLAPGGLCASGRAHLPSYLKGDPHGYAESGLLLLCEAEATGLQGCAPREHTPTGAGTGSCPTVPKGAMWFPPSDICRKPSSLGRLVTNLGGTALVPRFGSNGVGHLGVQWLAGTQPLSWQPAESSERNIPGAQL